MKTFFLSILLLFAALPSFADLARRDEFDLYVELLDGEKFEGYTFFLRFQTYYYDEGYQKGPTEEIVMLPGERYEASEKGNTSKIYARDAKGNVFESDEEVGGTVHYEGNGVSHFIDRYQVLGIKDGKVALKHVQRFKQTPAGKFVKVKKSGLDFGGNGFSWMSIVLPLVSLLALIAFFIFRRKAAARS